MVPEDCVGDHEEGPHRDNLRDVGRRYADIVATVTETIAHKDEACDGIERPAERRREITVTYRWDAAAGRYLPDSDAFETLAAENEQRF